MAQFRLARRFADSLQRTPFASTVSDGRLPVTVVRHESLLRRRLGSTDPALQDGKVANLALAIPTVDGLLIRPGETFSFWNRVGAPSARRGYQPGLVLRGGGPAAGTGGGLCQLSNLLHWMALHTPLEITERHHHSVDPFPDDRRALPFGTGAGVFYNYVDLRIRNTTAQTFQLEVWMTDRQLCGRIRTERELEVAYHVFETDHHFEAGPEGIVRCNQVWRRHVERRTGRTLHEEPLMRNRSRVGYPVDPAVLASQELRQEQAPPARASVRAPGAGTRPALGRHPFGLRRLGKLAVLPFVGLLAGCTLLTASGPTASPPVSSPPVRPLASPTAAAAQTAVPGASAGLPAWVRVRATALAGAPGDEYSSHGIRDATVFAGRLVAVGGDAVGGIIWSTGDGLTWTRTPPKPALDGIGFVSVAASDSRIVARGRDVEGVASTWTSTDGRNWRSIRSGPFPSRPFPLLGLHGLGYGPAGFVAIDEWLYGDCAFDCYMPTSIRSREGLGWSESTPRRMTGRGSPFVAADVVHGVTGTQDGYVAAGSRLWHSPDGRRWEEVLKPPAGITYQAVVVAGDLLFAVGGSESGPAIWTSVDGHDWAEATVGGRKGIRVHDVAAVPDGYLAVGAAGEPEWSNHDEVTHAVWSSADGREWHPLDPGVVEGRAYLSAVARIGDRTVLMGSALGPDGRLEIAAWTHRPLPEAPTGTAERPSAATWTPLPAIQIDPGVVREVRAINVDDEVLAVYQVDTGVVGEGLTGAVWIDPAAGTARSASRLPGDRMSSMVARAGGQVLVIGGCMEQDCSRAVEALDLATGKWQESRLLPRSVPIGPATRLPDGRILAVDENAPAWVVVDPVRWRVSRARKLPAPTVDAAVGLSGGRVLLLTARRTWTLDVGTGRAQPGPVRPRVGGLAGVAAMPDGRVLCLVTDAAGREWLDILSTDGASWSEQPFPGDLPEGDVAVAALDDRSLLLLVNQEVCDESGDCSYASGLVAGRLELGAASGTPAPSP